MSYEGRKRVLGENHIDTLISLYDLADNTCFSNRLESSKFNDGFELYFDCYKKRKAVLGAFHPDTLVVMRRVAVMIIDKKSVI